LLPVLQREKKVKTGDACATMAPERFLQIPVVAPKKPEDGSDVVAGQYSGESISGKCRQDMSFSRYRLYRQRRGFKFAVSEEDHFLGARLFRDMTDRQSRKSPEQPEQKEGTS
jgi:hypothetical protein